ncbi:MAG: HAD-IIIA family hydrolase, partial [Gloeobacteraceae cyanobacterium ES-bin-316]|nr:HAD-IIIA family hydrolase [Ferruginibacter sp.]
MIDFKKISRNCTLFLDRDGVINEEKPGGYVNNWAEFKFCEGALEAFIIFSRFFAKVVVVTNQRGVEKGITKLKDLLEIHEQMEAAVVAADGKLDAIYFCTDVDESSLNRKPNAGMALQAKAQFPEIEFSQSIMVGDKRTEMMFGKNLGMVTIFINTEPGGA